MAKARNTDGLSQTEEAYALARAGGLDHVQSYRQAQPKSKCKDTTARVQAYKIEKRPRVTMRIQALMVPAVQAVESDLLANLRRVLTENGAIAFSDVRKLVDEHGRLKRLEDLDDLTAAAIASVKTVTRAVPGSSDPVEYENVTEYKLWDKGGALDRFMKHLGAYAKDNQPKADDAFAGWSRDQLKQLRDALVERVSSTGPVVAEQPRRPKKASR